MSSMATGKTIFNPWMFLALDGTALMLVRCMKVGGVLGGVSGISCFTLATVHVSCFDGSASASTGHRARSMEIYMDDKAFVSTNKTQFSDKCSQDLNDF